MTHIPIFKIGALLARVLPCILFSFFLWVTILGWSKPAFALGGGNSEQPDIPIPPKNYQATIIDRTGTKIESERISIDGKIYLQGLVGRSTVNVPFEKMKSLKVNAGVSNKDKDYLSAMLTLKTGEQLELLVALSSKVYGDSYFGKFSLFARDLLSIDFKE